VRLGEADGGDEIGLLARGGVSGARLMLRKDWLEAAVRDTLGFIAWRRSK
jgi:hypothetical protein